MSKSTVLLATGNKDFDELLIPYLKDHWEIDPKPVDLRRFLPIRVKESQPDIVILHDKLPSELPEDDVRALDDEWISMIENIKVSSPETRIVFMGMRYAKDPFLLRLINFGVYDIFIGNQFRVTQFIEQLNKPASLANVAHIKNKQPGEPAQYLVEPPSMPESRTQVGSKTKSDGGYDDPEEYDEDEQDWETEEGGEERRKKKGFGRTSLNIAFPKIHVNLPVVQFNRSQKEIRTEYKAFAAKILTVASMKGGVGKTTIAINLAVAIREHTRTKIAILDFDFPYGGVAQALNVERTAHLGDWLNKTGPAITPLGVKQRVIEYEGIDIIPMATRVTDSLNFQKEQAEYLLDILKKVYDVIIVDTSNLTDPALIAIERSTEVILVTDHDKVAITNTHQYKRDLIGLYGNEHSKMSIFINKVPDDEDVSKEDIATVFEDEEDSTPVIGYAPFDDLVRIYRNQGKVIYLHESAHPLCLGIDMILHSLDIIPEEILNKRQSSGSKTKWFTRGGINIGW